MAGEKLATENVARQLSEASAQLSQKLRAGDQCATEDMLAEFPAITADNDSALELIYTEFVVREQLGQRPSAEDWQRMRSKILDAADYKREARLTSPVRALAVAAVAAAVMGGVWVWTSRWERSLPKNSIAIASSTTLPSDSPSTHVEPVSAMTDRRRIMFTAPRGTRIIWELESNLES